MYAPTAKGTSPGRRRADPQITASRPNVATNSLVSCAIPSRRCCEAKKSAGCLNMTWATATPMKAPTICAADVARHLAPGQAALARIRQRHDRIEVRARDRSEGDDQRDQRRARREGVGEQRERDVRARELLGHDPRPDDGGQQQRRSERLGDELPQQHFAAAVLAAVFPQVIRQLAKRVVVGGVIVERPLATRSDDARVDQTFQMVAERRGRQVDVGLDRPGGRAFGTRLDDIAQDGQANRVAEGPELLGVAFQFFAHGLLLNYSK